MLWFLDLVVAPFVYATYVFEHAVWQIERTAWLLAGAISFGVFIPNAILLVIELVRNVRRAKR
ncbi:hypothetical protein [Sandaracinus amylolyticus]|uniref:hypothetical protein n=1 Tax=Sandaracinus amylolyticus TaxID=927083 RepID=UPI001F24CA5D|nr:hypothetical protein [Sandaracinus amylolyticus]